MKKDDITNSFRKDWPNRSTQLHVPKNEKLLKEVLGSKKLRFKKPLELGDLPGFL